MSARIPTEQVEALRALIAPLDTEDRRAAYREGRFPRADRVKDLDKRYRWDLFWDTRGALGVVGERDLLDSHIDTALRRIVPALS